MNYIGINISGESLKDGNLHCVRQACSFECCYHSNTTKGGEGGREKEKERKKERIRKCARGEEACSGCL